MKIIFGHLFLFIILSCQENNKTDYLTISDKLEFIGIAVEEPGYHIWGSSPILGPKGKTHLFVARWPKEFKVDPGWRSHSEIARYVADNPQGPFRFKEIVITGSGRETWDKYGAHNPCIKKVDDSYILFYIANNNPAQPPHPRNQRIGMLIAKSPEGPWKKAGKQGMILQPSDDPDHWTYYSGNGVVNPAFLNLSQKQFYLYFKSWIKFPDSGQHKSVMGVAVSENLTGPYKITDQPITANAKTIEDGYAFEYNGKYYLLTTDNHGIFINGGGILWESADGLNFANPCVGYGLIDRYFQYDAKNLRRYYGPDVVKFERPQILVMDGKPAYMYAPSGCNIMGGEATVSYVLKISL